MAIPAGAPVAQLARDDPHPAPRSRKGATAKSLTELLCRGGIGRRLRPWPRGRRGRDGIAASAAGLPLVDRAGARYRLLALNGAKARADADRADENKRGDTLLHGSAVWTH